MEYSITTATNYYNYWDHYQLLEKLWFTFREISNSYIAKSYDFELDKRIVFKRMKPKEVIELSKITRIILDWYSIKIYDWYLE
jgi:hypothetical protein